MSLLNPLFFILIGFVVSLLVCICEIFCRSYILCFSDYKRSILYHIGSKLFDPKRYRQLQIYILIIFILSILTMFIYPPSINRFFIPMMFLMVFDAILSAILISYMKRFIFHMKIKDETIDKKLLFFPNNYNKKEIDKYHEYFLFRYPNLSTFTPQKPHNLIDLKNFIWILRLYKQGSMKHFAYVLGIVLVQLFFFLAIYRIYYIALLNTKSGLFIFLFLTLWTIYLVIKLKSLLGFNYFKHLLSDYQIKTKIEPLLRYITIYQIDKKSYEPRIYSVSQILQDTSDINKVMVKNLEYFIGFITTVLYVALLTYIMSQK